MKEEAGRVLRNLSRNSEFNTIINVEIVNYMRERYSDLVFVNGLVRRIKFELLTDKYFKVYSEAI